MSKSIVVELPELDAHWAQHLAVRVCDGVTVIQRGVDVLIEDEECLTSYPKRVAIALAAALLAAAQSEDVAQRDIVRPLTP